MKWIEVKYTLPRKEAREAAQKYFRRYPMEGYETHISHWHITPDEIQ